MCLQYVIGRVQSCMDNGKPRHIYRKHNTIKQLLLIRVISLDYMRFKRFKR